MGRWMKKNGTKNAIVFVLWLFFVLSGCSGKPESRPVLNSPAQMNAPEYTIGVPQGTAAMSVVEKNFPNCKIEYHASIHDGYLAVKYGKIDAFAFDRHALEYVVAHNPDLALMDEKIGEEFIVVGAAPARTDLIKKVNAFIKGYRADGTYADMYSRWLMRKNLKMPGLQEPEHPAMTLTIGTDGLNEPMNYYADGQLTGFDIEFAKRLALFLNAKFIYKTIEFPAIITAAATGKIDLLIANLNATPERRKMMLFSDTYVDSEVCFLVRKNRLSPKTGSGITDLAQLAGKKVGIVTGSTYDNVLKSRIPGAVPEYFNNFSDQTEAVKTGKIAGFLVDEPMARDIMNHTSGIACLKELLTSDGYAFAFPKNQTKLQKEVNAALKEMRHSGALKEIEARWFGADESAKILPDLKTEGANGVIRLATNSGMAPFAYMKHGKMSGYDIEIARVIASKLGRTLEIVDMDIAAIIPSLITGKSDMAACGITVTEERAQSVLFSIPNYQGGIAVMVAAVSGNPSGDAVTEIAQLAGKKVGVMTGTTYEAVLKNSIPEAVPMYFTNFSDQIEALKTKKISGFLVDEVAAQNMIYQTSGLTYIRQWLRTNEYAFAFSKNQPQLQEQINTVLKKLREDGTLRKLEAKWFGSDDTVKILPDLKLDGLNGVIRFATNSDSAPFVYMKNGKLVGYDIETAMIIASMLGRKLDLVDMDFAAIIPSLVSDKTDMAGAFIAKTKERAQSVLFSIPTYTGGTVVMVSAGAAAPASADGGGWRSGLIRSFKRTFLVEDRYKLVWQGLWVTIVITIFSAIAGTFLGFAICMARRARTRWANIPAKIFIRTIQGTPIVVLLMILYYVIFGSLDINAILVAVIGFSINFAAYVSEMMRTGIDAVDKGQHEAAYAIGFNRFQVFEKITFPQAARHVLPVFKGEFISMLKMTSVVGYIAIQDLTKISDIIRSRTYEAFFPLIATALIYFVIAYAMAWLLSRVEIRVDPKRRKRVVKGVVHP